MSTARQSGPRKAAAKADRSGARAPRSATGPSPVERFETHLQELEAALPVCRADPKRKAVHTLRSAIRAVEAGLALFGGLKGMPDARTEANALLDATQGLRRRAGRVRDLDVFEKLLEDHEAEMALDGDDIHRVCNDLRKLREACGRRRKRAARRLLKEIGAQETTVAAAAEAVRQVYQPVRERRFSSAELLRFVEHEFRSQHALKLEQPSDEDRHEIRKAAKKARLQLELAGDAPAASATAERFHDLQRAGGDWHDWRELTALASDELGRHRAATMVIATRRDRCLRVFEQQLAAFRAPAGRSRRAA